MCLFVRSNEFQNSLHGNSRRGNFLTVVVWTGCTRGLELFELLWNGITKGTKHLLSITVTVIFLSLCDINLSESLWPERGAALVCCDRALSMRSSPLCPKKESAVKLLVNTVPSTVQSELLVKISMTKETGLLYPPRASLDQWLNTRKLWFEDNNLY